jgi:hypothetical protein
MVQDGEGNVHFKVRRDGAAEWVERSRLINTDIAAIIEFYHSNL